MKSYEFEQIIAYLQDKGYTQDELSLLSLGAILILYKEERENDVRKVIQTT